MSIDLLPKFVRQNYECHEWRHACAIMYTDFRQEWDQMIDVLTRFRLYRNYITTKGGSKSHVSKWIDSELLKSGWLEKKFDTKILVDAVENPSPTHSVDCFKNRIALEIEWNNKDPFYDRDLNNFRLLHQLETVSVGVIVTRCSHLQAIFNKLGRAKSYGNSTTHMGKLLPKIKGGGAGGCPVLVLGISDKLYVNKDTVLPVQKKKSGADTDEDDEE